MVQHHQLKYATMIRQRHDGGAIYTICHLIVEGEHPAIPSRVSRARRSGARRPPAKENRAEVQTVPGDTMAPDWRIRVTSTVETGHAMCRGAIRTRQGLLK